MVAEKLCTLVCAILFLVPCVVYCEHYDPYDIGTSDADERINPHSFYYDRTTKKLIHDNTIEEEPEVVTDIVDTGTQLAQITSADNQSAYENIFYKRLVNLLLSNIHIQTKEGELITGILSIQASQTQIRILENFHETESSLREIDAILSEVIQKPKFDHVAEVRNLLGSIYETANTMFEVVSIHREMALIVLAVTACLLMLKTVKWRAGLSIFFIIQVIFVVSYFMTWWQLIQEAEIELTAKQMQFTQLPLACQPDKMNLWQKFTTLFTPDDCKKYYEAMMTNPKLQVTPVAALSHLVSNMIVHPVSNLGLAVSAFIENATGELPSIYAWIVKILLFVCVGIVIMILPFCLGGASFSIGLGPLFKFAIDCSKKRGTVNPSIAMDQRQPVEIILKLPEGITAQAIKDTPTVEKPKSVQQLTYIESEPKSSDNVCTDCKYNASASEGEESCHADAESDATASQDVQDSKVSLRKSHKRSPREEVGGGDN